MTEPGPKADYSAIAQSYDAARRLPESSIEQWVELIRDRGRLSPDSRCLDLGCGTGRFTIPLVGGVQAFGADLSAEMLAEAVSKSGTSSLWVACDAHALAFRSDVFQCVFMSLLLHHVDDVESVLRECYRVLRRGGACLVRTTAHDDMDTMPVYRFFPKAREIDRNRLPSISVIEDSMLRAGFRSVRHEKITQYPWVSSDDYLDKVRRKNISALTLLTEEEFAKGMNSLEQYIESLNEDKLKAEVLTDRMTLVVADK